ncbi:thermostable alkaline protease precursor [Fusarium subglutinans]|uniref:Thermostable alkaline protease n=1 Tax=Gibberella subglutinans TaxID=42677 RepID=A0A8H5PSX8_GIBSU|nr:thermostable alkaline protease precursor [Fusarium subglutinans]KAF5602860.1 thermostable alkaline protease precursor [Fusarium subglutinans]
MASERFSACELVVEVAKEVYALVMECGIRQRQRLAGEVGTRLGQIAQESFAGYELDQDAEDTAAKLLHTLLDICMFPTPAGSQIIPRQDYMQIVVLSRPDNRSRLKKCISMSFITDKTLPVQAKEQCDAFLAKLSQDEPKKKTGLDQLTTGSALPEPDDYPQHVSRNLFEALRQHAFCQHAEMTKDKSWLRKSNKAKPHHHKLAHPIRLHLDATPYIQSKHAQFEVVISSENMSYWQHLWLGIPMQTKGRRGGVTFANVSSDEDGEDKVPSLKRINSDYFCQVLKHQLFAKVNLNFVKGIGLVSLPPPAPLERFLCPGQGLPLSLAIQSYKLTDKDKILLAHAIAHSFWQFYESDLMKNRWTSDDIWFMQEMDHQHLPKDQLALRVYMPLDFEDEQRNSEDEDKSMLTHPFPHILGLGLILLQIGLVKPFKSMTHLPFISRLNRDHGAARQLLGELEKAQWARSTHRDIFARAVANCLDPRTFTTTTPKPKAIKGSTKDGLTVSACEDGIRRKVYTEVVEPLSKLVNIAFKADAKYVSYLARCREVENHNKLHCQVASFHTGKTIVPEEWLDNLKHISMHIMNLREEKPDHDFKPVKIAVLDTGCDAALPFNKIPRRKKSIKAWKDFTRPGSEDKLEPDTMKDEYGHGSLMTRLIMEAAPLAHIYVARVAKNTRDLEFSSNQIAQAIRWAGLEAEADIISMSFGFPHDDDVISAAIEDVERNRDITFLASAGNSAAYQREAFPARHRSVISMRATDCQGTFNASNPPITDRSTVALVWFPYMPSWVIDSDSGGCWYSSVDNSLRRGSLDSSSNTYGAKPGKVFEEN